MTPTSIRARLLAVQQQELMRIASEIHGDPPVDALELLRCCQRELARVKSEAETLKAESAKSDRMVALVPRV